MVDFGYPIGPFAVADLSGLDIGYDSRQRRAAREPELPQAADRRPRSSRRGGSGRRPAPAGIRYEKGDRTPHPDPEVARIIKEKAAEMGVAQRSFTDEEILRRLLFASVNEACKILEEGKAYRASDIDVMWLHGFGFPRYRGGLMYWADGIGVARGLPTRSRPGTSNTASAGRPRRCCAASPKPTRRCAKRSPAAHDRQDGPLDRRGAGGRARRRDGAGRGLCRRRRAAGAGRRADRAGRHGPHRGAERRRGATPAASAGWSHSGGCAS